MTNPLASILAALLASLALVGCGAPVSDGDPDGAVVVDAAADAGPSFPHPAQCPQLQTPSGPTEGARIINGGCAYFCRRGFGTCDNVVCGTNVHTNINHCGECGRRCVGVVGDRCAEGRCG